MAVRIRVAASEVRSYWHTTTPRPPVLQVRAEDPVLLFLRPLLRACRGRHPGTGPLAARLVAETALPRASAVMNAGADTPRVNRAAGGRLGLPRVIKLAQPPGDRLGVGEIARRRVDIPPAGGTGAPPRRGPPAGPRSALVGQPVPGRGDQRRGDQPGGGAAGGAPRRPGPARWRTRARISPASSTAVRAFRQTSATRTSTRG